MRVFSVGHSTLPYKRFVTLIRSVGITAIADVRSSPYSRRYPHFSQSSLKAELKADGIAYSFLGDQLGGRPKGSEFFCDGVADYEKMAARPEFSQGINRVVKGAEGYKIALMCSEHNPLDCHRCLLVGRALKYTNIEVAHLLSNGSVKPQSEIEMELLREVAHTEDDLFLSDDERIASAYRQRASRVAFSLNNPPYSQAAE